MTLIRELINIPTVVNEGDFVLKLTTGVDDAHAAQTVEQYVVTDDLVTAFDSALGLVASSVGDGSSRAVYLHGSFGSGKSHFMAMLHLLLSGNHHARSKPQLHAPLSKHEDALAGKRFLQVPLHFLTAKSMESAILGGYTRHVREAHPDAPLPSVFLADAVLDQDLPITRTDLDEDVFLSGLNEAAGGGWGEFGGSWSSDRVDAALAEDATVAERNALAAAYNQRFSPSAVDTSLTTGDGFINLDDGLAAISAHASGLKYDGIILFLDELILWLAASIGDLGFVHREAQKLAKLVESTNADRPVPIVSFVARQRDLKDLVGDQVAGAEVTSLGDTLELMAGRFGRITLEDRNLPMVAKERLLKPIDAAAEQQLRATVDGLRDDVRVTLQTNDADIELFRSVYPFSPALVQALVAVSEVLQRERTALKVMLQLLVDQRDELELGQFVPVGDLWDVVARSEEPFSSDLKQAFNRAKRLYREKLQPMLTAEHGIDDSVPADDPRRTFLRADDRILKTLLLAALVERVPAFADLNVSRLVALNWGSVKAPVPGKETQVLAGKIRGWASRVGEIKVGADSFDPLVSIALVDVDTDAIIGRAAEAYDNLGTRKRLLRQLLVNELTGELGETLSSSYKMVWRGTDREIDVVFGNLRDSAEVPDATLKAQPGKPKLLIDFPFDESGHGPEEDLERLDRYAEANAGPTTSVCWMPSFLNQQGLTALKNLVTLEELFTGPSRFEQHTSELSDNQRREAKPVLENRRATLRAQLTEAIKAAYGVTANEHPLIDTNLTLADHFRSLDPAMSIRPTTHPTFGGALDELNGQMLEHLHPGHPDFEDRITPAQLATAWTEIQRAIGDPDGRANVENKNRRPLRNIANPLQLGNMHESHFVIGDYWKQQLDRHLAAAEEKGAPLTVGELRELVDQTGTAPKGMPTNLADLVVATVAAQTSHALKRGGLPATYDGKTVLASDTVVERQQLPSSDEWTAARERASALFGINPSPLVSTPAVAELAEQLRTKAKGAAEECRSLDERLTTIYRDLDIETGNRKETAAAAVRLTSVIGTGGDTAVVAAFAGFEMPASLPALGRSISTARAVEHELAEANWQLLKAGGSAIVSQLTKALSDDEFVTPIDVELRELERLATVAVVPGPGPIPPIKPEPTTTETRTVSAENLDEVLDEISGALADGPLSVSWTPATQQP